MRYDPIMCMMVDDSVKTKDANKYVEKAVQLIKEGKGPIAILSTLKGMGLTPADANSYYAEAKSLTGYRSYDEKALDKAIKTCDASSITYNEIKSVYNLVSDALMYRNDEKKVTELLRKSQSELLTLATKTK